MGLGMGALMQNLVLAVQNTVDVRDIGAASATVAFFRSLGGAVGVSVLGAVLAARVATKIAAGLKQLGMPAGGSGSSGTLDLNGLPAPVIHIVRVAYGDATGRLFMIAAGIAVISLLAVLFIREVPLRTTVGLNDDSSVPANALPDAEKLQLTAVWCASRLARLRRLARFRLARMGLARLRRLTGTALGRLHRLARAARPLHPLNSRPISQPSTTRSKDFPSQPSTY